MHYSYHIRIANRNTVVVEQRDPYNHVLGEPTGTFGYKGNAKSRILQLQEAARIGTLGEEGVYELGERLFNTLFDRALHQNLFVFYEQARRENLTVRIELDIDERELSSVASLPWEFMRVPADAGFGSVWLATAPDLVFARRRTHWIAPEPIQLKKGERLRIAVVVSTPEGLGNVRYQVVWRQLEELSLAQRDRIELLPLVDIATPRSIDEVLRQRPHIFHFIGHARFVDDLQQEAGQVALVDQDISVPSWISAERFSTFFNRHQPGIVLLQACEGGALSSSQAFVGVASQIVQQNIPVVIAMQYDISNATAQRFASEFYNRLSHDDPVDRAVQEARLQVALGPRAYSARDFATPVLFMRPTDGQVFRRFENAGGASQMSEPETDEKLRQPNAQDHETRDKSSIPSTDLSTHSPPTDVIHDALRTVRAYISYSPIDATDKCEQIRNHLAARGIKAWFRNQNIDASAGELSSEIEKNIARATHVILCVTPEIDRPDSVVQLELSSAIYKDKAVIPVLFPGGHKPLLIAADPGIDCSDWDGAIEALWHRLTQPTPVTSSPKSPRDLEFVYLQVVGRRYDHWCHLYTELHLSGHIKKQKVKARNSAARRILDRQHDVFTRISHDLEDVPSDKLIVETFRDLARAIQEYRRVAIIGEPGSGKSTTLERLAFKLAVEAAKSDEAPLPLLVRLGGYSGGGLNELIASQFGDLNIQNYLPSRIVVLLDGLNELPVDMLTEVVDWIQRNSETSIIVSCRRLDYLERKLPLQRIDIAPLDITRIYSFIGNYLEDEDRDRLFWALAGEVAHHSWVWLKYVNANATFEDFWFGNVTNAHSYEVEKLQLKYIQDSLRIGGTLPGLLGLVTNPFLLFAVLHIFYRLGEPPRNRGELFEQFVGLLIEHRGKAGIKPGYPWVEEVVQRAAMSKLAYRMQIERTPTSVDDSWVLNTLSSDFPNQDPNLLLYFACSAGLLERNKQVRFAHQLLQEYFAAGEMAEDMKRGVPATKYWPSEKWWEPTGWEETAVLLAGMQGNSTEVVQWLTPIQPTLAYRCATECGAPCDLSVLQVLYEPPPNALISPVARAEWGRILGRRGDTRPGVGLRSDGLPDIDWCLVPAGKFQMGGDLDLDVLGIAWEGAEIDIPYSFWIAKYPTTYAHFEAFVSDGYNVREYWTEAGWRWKGSQKYPRLWNDPKFNISNHPVVGVTWYEAYAYTRWLNASLHIVGVTLPELCCEWEISLPLEAEWEKAARYPDGRKYPWGDQYIPGYANIDETYENAECGPYCMRCTTAVGMYAQGANPNGALDLCGNVWEWCLSKWDVIYRFPEDSDPEGTEHRSVRGASWFNSKLFAPAAAHDCLDADLGVQDVGFRIILRPTEH